MNLARRVRVIGKRRNQERRKKDIPLRVQVVTLPHQAQAAQILVALPLALTVNIIKRNTRLAKRKGIEKIRKSDT